ncbi:DUF2341 domain-containing protein [Myxococcota bacterium]|nr:DUF2341 domain-containing protein [Myxococcota bacterium]MBU1379262.1 DUF2341 domain-containing protein [Myxococcota bacterium]MBU1496205.1 DUF2341 domain-containing protein [Myxococcota bacterium]
MINSLIFAFLLTVTGETWFNFQALEPGQSGEYTHTQNITIDNFSAFLSQQEIWHAPGWSYRYTLHVENTGTFQENFPVRVDLSAMPAFFFDNSTWNGRDIRVFDSDGNIVTAFWLEYYNFIEMSGSFWIRIPSLYVTDMIFYIYFGNEDANTYGDWTNVFKYPAVTTTAMWPWGDGDVIYWPFDASLSIDTGDGTVLSFTDFSSQTAFTPSGIISSNGPFSAASTAASTDSVVPFSMAGTTFTFPAYRDMDIFTVHCPTGSADVTISSAGTVLTSFMITADSTQVISQDVTGSYVIESTAPVVIAHSTDAGNDAHPLIPASNVLWGASTGSTVVSAVNDNTSVTAYFSDGTSSTYAIAAGNYTTIEAGGPNGTVGRAMRLVADGPIGALSLGDGDGGEAVAFYPEHLMATLFRIPTNSRYTMISAKHPSTICEELTAEGTAIQTITTTSYAPLFAGLARMTNLTAGNFLNCSGPVWAMYEDSVTLDERQLLSVKDFRPVVHPDPSIASEITGSVSLYNFGPGNVTTAQFEVPWDLTSWRDIEFYDPTVFAPNSDIRYQISQDNGTTWQYYDGTAWQTATDDTAMSAAMLQYSFPLLDPVPYLKLRIFLTGDGAATPIQGPIKVTYDYEEEPASFRISEIPSPQYQGQAFDVTVEAVDNDGRILTGFNKTLAISAGGKSVSPAISPALVNGRLTFKIAIMDSGEDVVLSVVNGQTVGSSNAFDVMELEASSIIKVAGDNQWGNAGTALNTDLLVRVINENQEGVALRNVTFTVSAGSGTFSDGSTTLNFETDISGYASVSFIPSEGLNEISASSPDLGEVVFTIRGDSDELSDAEGSMSCTSSGRSHSGSFPFVFMIIIVIAISIRRKYI